MKYIFDKPVTEWKTLTLSFESMSEEQLSFCYANLPDLEIISEDKDTISFIVDNEGWFTSSQDFTPEDLISFEEVFDVSI